MLNKDVENQKFARKPVTIDTSNVVVNRHFGYMMGNRPERDMAYSTDLNRSKHSTKSY